MTERGIHTPKSIYKMSSQSSHCGFNPKERGLSEILAACHAGCPSSRNHFHFLAFMAFLAAFMAFIAFIAFFGAASPSAAFFAFIAFIAFMALVAFMAAFIAIAEDLNFKTKQGVAQLLT